VSRVYNLFGAFDSKTGEKGNCSQAQTMSINHPINKSKIGQRDNANKNHMGSVKQMQILNKARIDGKY